MTQEEKMEYIKSYCAQPNPDIQLFQADNVSTIPEGVIPESWHEIFSETNINKRINKVLDMWKKYVAAGYSNTIKYMEENLVNIELLRVNKKYSMLYSVKTEGEEITFYEGGNLIDQSKGKSLEEQWDKIPLSIRSFYENVHNGFYEYSSWSMGMDALRNVTYFADEEWGIIEDLKEPLQIDLKSTFSFFNNGGGGYVAVDTKNCNNDNATLWFSDDQPEYNKNFWDLVDEWTVIGLQGI